MKKEKLLKVHDRVARYGVWAALLTWLPVVGDLIAIAMGLMRVNPWWTLVLMFIPNLSLDMVQMDYYTRIQCFTMSFF